MAIFCKTVQENDQYQDPEDANDQDSQHTEDIIPWDIWTVSDSQQDIPWDEWPDNWNDPQEEGSSSTYPTEVNQFAGQII